MALREAVPDRLDFRTLSDLAVTRLRDDILSGALKPGQKLDQTELARRFGISRAPVRDALRKLEAEGLVTIYPERGAFVAVIDLEEMQEIYEIRELLQARAVLRSVPRLTDEEVAAMNRLEDEMEIASRRGDMAQWLQLDVKFHAALYQHCTNRRLLKLISDYWNTTHQFRRAYIAVPGRMGRAEAMHRRMLEAVRARDGELCAKLAVEHARESVRGILEAHRDAPSEPPALLPGRGDFGM